MSSFENLRIVDNFYQTSLYFPMPTVIISTLCEDGTTTLGPYSLVVTVQSPHPRDTKYGWGFFFQNYMQPNRLFFNALPGI